jgi:hypothetical protein
MTKDTTDKNRNNTKVTNAAIRLIVGIEIDK